MKKFILFMIFVTVVVCFSLLYMFINDKTSGSPKSIKNDFNVHPYALYLLYGGDYSLADSKSSIVSVDVEAVAKSNEICNLKILKEDGWTGFVRKNKDGLLKFRYKVYRKLENTGYFIVKCTKSGEGSDSFGETMLVRKYKQKSLLYGKSEYLTILSCKGIFDYDIKDSDLKEISSFIRKMSL